MGWEVLVAIWVDKCVVGVFLKWLKNMERQRDRDKAGYFLHLTREYNVRYDESEQMFVF